MDKKELYSTKEAAMYLGITEQTMRDWRRLGTYQIPTVRIGRLCKYAKTDLDAFIQERRISCKFEESSL